MDKDVADQQNALYCKNHSFSYVHGPLGPNSGPLCTNLVLQAPIWSFRSQYGPSGPNMVLYVSTLVLQVPIWSFRSQYGPSGPNMVL